MKLKVLIFSVLLATTTAFSQTQDEILTMVEQNNTTLKATRQMVDAEKIGNRTGIAPNNPEVEFGYMWGAPTEIGSKINLNVRQEFDFPSAYFYRNDIAKLKNEQAELEFKNARQELLCATRIVCCELIYCNQLRAELQHQIEHAEKMTKLYEKRLETGDCNIFEYNKSQLFLLNFTKQQESNDIERTSLLSQLQSLNGGIFVDFSATEWPNEPIPTDFEEWYATAEANNPLLAWLKKELDLAQKEVKLSRANAAPKWSAGYALEHLASEQFQGITVGISIPLWQDANKVKYAKAKTVAAENSLKDKQLQFYNQLKKLHTQTVLLQKNAADYAVKMDKIANYELLDSALESGEISLIDYLYEQTIYYENRTKLLQMHLEAEKKAAELKTYF